VRITRRTTVSENPLDIASAMIDSSGAEISFRSSGIADEEKHGSSRAVSLRFSETRGEVTTPRAGATVVISAIIIRRMKGRDPGAIIETRQIIEPIRIGFAANIASAPQHRRREIYVTALSGDFARFPINCPCKSARGAANVDVDRITSVSALAFFQVVSSLASFLLAIRFGKAVLEGE